MRENRRTPNMELSDGEFMGISGGTMGSAQTDAFYTYQRHGGKLTKEEWIREGRPWTDREPDKQGVAKTHIVNGVGTLRD